MTLSLSQTSLNIHFLITSFHLYTVYRPYEALDINKYRAYFQIDICSGLSFVNTACFKQTLWANSRILKNVFSDKRKVGRLIEPKKIYKTTEKMNEHGPYVVYP